MQHHLQLEPNNYYHIYNRGINSCNLFTEIANYQYFMGLYEKYISTVAHTYAWVLMPNHFHFLIKVFNPSHQFSKLFNAYAQAFNKRYSRHGSLFERPFRRKLITDAAYLKQLVLYIHNNPVHHGFCNHPVEYAWSIYLTCISIKPTKIMRSEVMGWFDSNADFRDKHSNNVLMSITDEWLEVEHRC